MSSIVRRALFPVSVDSKSFSTATTVSALKQIDPYVDEIVVFVADRLQLYNKAEAVKDGASLCELVASVAPVSPHLAERKKWFDRLFRSPELEAVTPTRYRVLGVDDVTDRAYHWIYRNVLIAFATIAQFRADVQANAAAHMLRRRHDDAGMSQRLSECYILEDIAINVRFHLVDGVEAEYYIGDYLDALLGLYDGRYGIDIGCFWYERRPLVHRFLTADRSAEPFQWFQVLSADLR